MTSPNKTCGLYSGCGNEFLLIDDRNGTFPLSDARLIQEITEDLDGVIILQKSVRAHFRMRIFNKDGSEAEMCGNGIRCLIQFLSDLGIKKQIYTIETMAKVLRCRLDPKGIAVEMGQPTDVEWDIKLQSHHWHFLNTGVPHLVTFVEDLEEPNLMNLGEQLRFDPRFAPHGVNVNFAKVFDNHIKMRTYERGVEGETLACGTGATAVALAAQREYNFKKGVRIITRSGEELFIYLDPLTMIGPAKHLCE